MDKIIENLRLLLQKYDWGQHTLAKKSGVAESQISKILNKKRKFVSFDILERLAKALHVTVSQLTGEEPLDKKEVNLTDEEKEFLELYRKINDKDLIDKLLKKFSEE